METDVDPIAILEQLARGERAAARAALAAETAGSRLVRALRHTLATTGYAASVVTPTGPFAEPDADADAVERAAWSLECAARAARALSEGRVDDLVTEARRADESAPARYPWVELRAASLMQSAFRFAGSGDLFREAVASCSRAGDRTGRPHVAVVARALLASLHMMAGRLHAAMDRCDAALELAAATGLADSPDTALAHQFRGYVLQEWNRLDEADAALRTAWKLAGPEGRGVRSGVARVLATVNAARGEVAESNVWIGRLEEIVAEPMTLRNREWLAAVRIQQAVLVSRAPEASAGARRAGLREVEAWRRGWDYEPLSVDEWDDDRVRSRLHELDHAMFLLETTRQWPAALGLADRVIRATPRWRAGYLLRAWTVRAVALLNRGEPAAALEAWVRALELGEPGGFVRAYLDGSETRARLLRMASSDPRAATSAVRVATHSEIARAVPDHEGLTDRQLQVLTLIAGGLSNQAIADELELGLSTVKTHVREVLRRLSASSRTAAVARARERGYL